MLKCKERSSDVSLNNQRHKEKKNQTGGDVHKLMVIDDLNGY